MAEGGVSSPIWARTNRGSGNFIGTLFSIIGFLLAILGFVLVVMAVMNHNSFGEAGGKLDHWIAPVVGKLPGSKPADQPAATVAPASAPASAPAAASSAPASK
jgi:hypothetical protein